MNKKSLIASGVPENLCDEAIACIKSGVRSGYFSGKTTKAVIKRVIDDPVAFTEDNLFSDFANKLIDANKTEPYVPDEPIKFPIWNESGIDQNAINQMKVACQLPVTAAAALMGDAHFGYGLPVGGVLATENAVIPYAVGVDIACRMKLSILDVPVIRLNNRQKEFESALQDGTVFGVGGEWKPRFEHGVMDCDWNVSPVTKQMKDRAWTQLGTSGGGNHFAEFGLLTLSYPDMGMAAGEYVALMTHSGSRGTGMAVCNEYSGIAKSRLPDKYRKYFENLAWLGLDTEAGQEYWAAMELMGRYASANHACIHFQVAKLVGGNIIHTVEHHHNFAWKEVHGGRELIVHRKGATPAHWGEMGVIPGSMADPAYIVRGKGEPTSLMSASHGAGRKMSRRQAYEKMDPNHWKGVLRQRRVKLISGGVDELPGAYKDIRTVMEAQRDLVSIVAKFEPRVVKMADDGKSED